MNNKIFFDSLRKTLYKSGLPQTAVDSLELIIKHAKSYAGVTSAQVAYMMATAYHETGSALTPKTENLHYTTAARLRAVWPSRFKTNAAAEPYVKNAQKLANLVYGGRLGNTGPNDGWTYRGRGHIQTTGKENYAKVKKFTGVDVVSSPDKILDLPVSTLALVHGMIHGIYTGKKLSDFDLPKQFYNARDIVNGDKSRKEGDGTPVGTKIANTAKHFHAALEAAGYSASKEASKIVVTPANPVPDFSQVDMDDGRGKDHWFVTLIKTIVSLFALFSSKGK